MSVVVVSRVGALHGLDVAIVMTEPGEGSGVDGQPTRNGGVRVPLPPILCTTEPSDSSDEGPHAKPMTSSHSKLSLPSDLGTPTSPLKISSPLSLPASPTPYGRAAGAQSMTRTKTRSVDAAPPPPGPDDGKENVRSAATTGSGSATGE
ncbi:hypothetical protein EVAR_26820_1 [Eumeta japonica]|uniref:Uncharacterized protein n=1 Tax=Eumeta variegata TaxID=151549 RepID=A0A4C1WDD9_EUMVA|nr:hypothetical protein EVAR_26820_1 [Eumeta japonica]